MKIFNLIIKTVTEEDYQALAEGKPVELSFSGQRYFSSKKKALEEAKKRIKKMDKEYEVVRVEISEFKVDKLDFGVLNSYDKKLKHIGSSIDEDEENKNEKKSKYKSGQWVFVISGPRLECGIMAVAPDRGEAGYVIYESLELNDCSPHEHCYERNIFKSITEKEAQKLLCRKHFANIKLRYKEYQEIEERRKNK